MTQSPNMMDAYIAANPNSILARAMSANTEDDPSARAGLSSFAAGGMVAPGGGAVRPGAGMMQGAGMQSAIPADEPQMGASAPAPLQAGQINQEVQQLIQKNPQVVEHVRQLVAAAIQDGSLTAQELNMMVQLAKTAIANPAAYPQIRQFAIENGLGTEQNTPQEFDAGFAYILMVVGQAMQGQGAPAQGGAAQVPGAPAQGNAMQGQRPGGILPEYSGGGSTGDTEHVGVLHPREYVVTEKALLWHGKKKFDAMVKEADEAENPNAAQ